MSGIFLSRRAVLGGTLAAGLGLATAGHASAAPNAQVESVTWLSSRDVRVRVRSAAMRAPVGVRVLLPASYAAHPGRRYPVLYLLHGSSDDGDAWLDRYGARPVLDPAEVITVMPDGGRGGWYSDHPFSSVGRADWETLHTEHLVSLVDEGLRTLPRASARAIAGFSMGGYGAARYAGRHPDLYGAVSTYSGATDGYDLAWRRLMYSAPGNDGENLGPIFGVAPGAEDRGDLYAHDPGSYAWRLRGHRVRVYAGTTTDFELHIRASSRVYYDKLVAAGVRDLAWTDIPGGHTYEVAVGALRTDLPGLLSTLDRPTG